MERSSEIFQIHGVSTILTQKKIEYVTIIESDIWPKGDTGYETYQLRGAILM